MNTLNYAKIARQFFLIAAAKVVLSLACMPSNETPSKKEIVKEGNNKEKADGIFSKNISTGLYGLSKVVHVKINNEMSPSADGTSWAKAYSSLTTALEKHKDEDHLSLVVSAPSTLRLTKPLELHVFNGTTLSILGGYKGDETDLFKVEAGQESFFPANPLVIDANATGTIFVALSNAPKKNRRIRLFGMELRNASNDNGPGHGGALNMKECILEINRTKWINNKGSSGGAIFVQDSTLEISGPTTFEGNSAISGGAITAASSTILINAYTQFINNSAIIHNFGNGGGILASGGTTLKVNAAMNFINNQASFMGSAIYLEKPIKGDTSHITGAKKAAAQHHWEQI